MDAAEPEPEPEPEAAPEPAGAQEAMAVDGAEPPAETPTPTSANPDAVLKGRCVSGRWWKGRDERRASSVVNAEACHGASVPWEERQAKRRRLEEVRQLEADLKAAKRQEIEDKKARREEQLKRKQANELKATTMQTITKTHKLKTMNKKQLRAIKKTAVNAQTGQVELVSPWAK